MDFCFYGLLLDKNLVWYVMEKNAFFLLVLMVGALGFCFSGGITVSGEMFKTLEYKRNNPMFFSDLSCQMMWFFPPCYIWLQLSNFALVWVTE